MKYRALCNGGAVSVMLARLCFFLERRRLFWGRVLLFETCCCGQPLGLRNIAWPLLFAMSLSGACLWVLRRCAIFALVLPVLLLGVSNNRRAPQETAVGTTGRRQQAPAIHGCQCSVRPIRAEYNDGQTLAMDNFGCERRIVTGPRMPSFSNCFRKCGSARRHSL